MTRRGRSILALGLLVYLAAWAFGSKPLYPVATGLLLVCVVAWGWVHLANGPFRIFRGSPGSEHVEGDDVQIPFAAEPGGVVRPPVATLVERVGSRGEQRHVLRRRGRRLAVTYVLERVRRGRYEFSDCKLELSDPFGLHRVLVPLRAPGALLVYPRIVHLERLFSETGAQGAGGRRLLLHRPAGYDLHSVREYEEGESLRKVHWPSTARRGYLMVKELEDAPHDEIAVVLDAAPDAVVGESFDMQVRAAASILDVYIRRGRRVVLVVNGGQRTTQQVNAATAGRQRAFEVLAAAEPGGRTPLSVALADEGGAALRALELVVVTALLNGPLIDRLTQRANARRRVSLVHVDAPTFAGAPPRPIPALLRLHAAGVSVAVVRAGDDLATALSGESETGAAAHG